MRAINTAGQKKKESKKLMKSRGKFVEDFIEDRSWRYHTSWHDHRSKSLKEPKKPHGRANICLAFIVSTYSRQFSNAKSILTKLLWTFASVMQRRVTT